MKIKTNITESREVDISLPFFRRKIDGGWTYLSGALNNNQFVKMTIFERYISICHSHPNDMTNEIANAMEWDTISEEQFLEAHESVLRSLSLVPKLHEIDMEIEDELSKTNDPDDLKDVL